MLTRLGLFPLAQHCENERYRVSYTLQTRSDAPHKDRTSKTTAGTVELATSLHRRLMESVVLMANVYVAD